MSTEPASAALDVAALRRALDGDHHVVRDRVRELLSDPCFDRSDVGSLDRDAYRDRVLDWTRRVAATGETMRGYPEEVGGRHDVAGFIAGFETFAFGDLSLLVKIGVQFGLWGGAIQQLGNAEQRLAYLPRVGSLELPGCFAMTERGHGSDVQALRTTATYDPVGAEFVIDTPDDQASKDWIGNAARHGREAVVFAQLVVGGESHGVHALLVPLRDEGDDRALPGIRIEDCGDKLGLQGVDNGRLWFDGVRVPRTALLDRFGSVDEAGVYSSPIESPGRRFFTMLGTLVQGRVSVGGAAVSASKSALTIAIRHGLDRRQFEDPDGTEVPVMDYLAHQRRLLPLLATSYALSFAQHDTVDALDAIIRAPEGEDVEERRRELEPRAAGLKAVATWHATETIQECREACGGAGYLRDAGFAALKADTDVFTTFEGDNTVLLQLVGKTLLTGFRDDFGNLSPLGTAGFVAGQVLDVIVERTAVRQVLGAISDVLPRRDGDEGGLERADQLELVREREEHLVSRVAQRLRAGIKDGRDPFEVFSYCQPHLLAAARSHVDRFVLESFAARVEREEDAGTKAILDRLCDLHALRTIERERAWYLEHGRISGGRSKEVTRLVDRRCHELRPHAADLVDAFGIPDAVLASRIGAKDVTGDRW
ncbi:acyl-CoA dehydrogenase [Patulibacter minatonensis]|uniref:acyl-CoA dehydrogenase family protein n=1 Tax=Patulibacter minatonensis TaxID=298163 RepID=UPI00047BF7AE|nr:acyl-CoA dehydrogenase [Patulibacter minatonensis]